MKRFLVQKLCKVFDVIRRESETTPLAEDIYRYFFVRELSRFGIEDRFYPIGNAANFSLMYVILRVLVEFPVSRVVEFGAGQTSVLLDKAGTHLGRDLEVVTLEHDAFWADTIGRQVNHPVLPTPLVNTKVGARTVPFYDLTQVLSYGTPDFVIIDGPSAHLPGTYFNRTGAIDYLNKSLGDEFVVVIDDAERPGERVLAGLVRDKMQKTGHEYYENTIKAAKQQRLFCTQKYRAAAYF